MAKFRMNHARKGRGSTGYVVRIAAAAFLFFGFLFFLLHFFRHNALPLSGKYGTDPAERFYLPESTDKALFHYPLFSIAYDRDRHIPAWGAYELDAGMIADKSLRRKNWKQEAELTEIPAVEWLQQEGLTAAQLVPDTDVGAYKPARKASYRSSNLCLQDQDFNRQCWLPAEARIRQWATQTGFLYVVSGAVTDPALLQEKNGFFIPRYFYKIVVDLSVPEVQGLGMLLARTDRDLQLEKQLVPIDSLERLTGIDFFPELMTDSLEQLVEQGVDLDCWK